VERLFDVVTESNASYQVFLRLLAEYDIQGTAVHDARLASVMIRDGIDSIVTFNVNDFRRFEPEGVRIVTPVELADGKLP